MSVEIKLRNVGLQKLDLKLNVPVISIYKGRGCIKLIYFEGCSKYYISFYLLTNINKFVSRIVQISVFA